MAKVKKVKVKVVECLSVCDLKKKKINKSCWKVMLIKVLI